MKLSFALQVNMIIQTGQLNKKQHAQLMELKDIIADFVDITKQESFKAMVLILMMKVK